MIKLRSNLGLMNLLALFFLLFFSLNSFAEQFVPPEEVIFSEKVYKLAYKQISPNGRAIYEYTSNNESVEKWTTLITLNYAKDINSDPKQWLEALKKQLKQNDAFPDSYLYVKEKRGYARFTFPPVKNYPEFESNIHKSFHISSCGGLLVYQYAIKYPKDTNLMLINYESEKLGSEIEVDSWVPECK